MFQYKNILRNNYEIDQCNWLLSEFNGILHKFRPGIIIEDIIYIYDSSNIGKEFRT